VASAVWVKEGGGKPAHAATQVAAFAGEASVSVGVMRSVAAFSGDRVRGKRALRPRQDA